MILAPLSPSDPRLMNTATATPMDSVPTSAEYRLHRRSREEVEVLAKNFIATPAADAPAPVQRRTNLAFATGGIVLAALLVILAWPEAESEVQRPAADTSRAAAEAEQWRARYEAERERKRRELQAGSDYLAKMAAAESAVLKEMGARASRLTAEPEAAEPASARPAPQSSEPTPRDAPAPAPRRTAPVATASSAPAPAASQPQPADAKPAPVDAAQDKSTTAAPPVAVAAAPQCKLHVSQLSSSGTLTYDDVKRMKGVRVVGGGDVLTPPIALDDGRRVTFQVAPDGCMKWRRAS